MFSALFTSFLVLMFVVGAPLAFAMLLSSVVALWYYATLPGVAPIPWVVTPQRMFIIVDSFPLMAVPYFILAGELMERGGISVRLVKFAVALVMVWSPMTVTASVTMRCGALAKLRSMLQFEPVANLMVAAGSSSSFVFE